jgi:hypothetical protein
MTTVQVSPQHLLLSGWLLANVQVNITTAIYDTGHALTYITLSYYSCYSLHFFHSSGQVGCPPFPLSVTERNFIRQAHANGEIHQNVCFPHTSSSHSLGGSISMPNKREFFCKPHICRAARGGGHQLAIHIRVISPLGEMVPCFRRFSIISKYHACSKIYRNNGIENDRPYLLMSYGAFGGGGGNQKFPLQRMESSFFYIQIRYFIKTLKNGGVHSFYWIACLWNYLSHRLFLEMFKPTAKPVNFSNVEKR